MVLDVSNTKIWTYKFEEAFVSWQSLGFQLSLGMSEFCILSLGMSELCILYLSMSEFCILSHGMSELCMHSLILSKTNNPTLICIFSWGY